MLSAEYRKLLAQSDRKLNDLNRRICQYGFDSLTLQNIEEVAIDIDNGTTVFERIPQEQLSGLSARYGFLCQAAIICRGCPRTESESREIYCTDDLAGDGVIQQSLIEDWAKRRGVWFDNAEEYLQKISQIRDDGTESAVFFDIANQLVRKLISLKYYNVVRLALDRLIIHNALFPTSSLKVLGFGRDSLHRFVIVVEQPYVRGRGVTEDERLEFMTSMGFEDAGMDYGMHLNYKTDTLYIGDLNEFNVLKGEKGIQVIDADCRLNVKTLGCGGSYVIPQPSEDFFYK